MKIMTRTLTHRSGEQGAILVQVAISIFVLMCFLVFVFDYGVVWASRAQAQNSADAGALAGAIARGYDEFTNPPAAGGPTDTAARLVAQGNPVWKEAGGVGVSYDCPPGVSGGGCVRVDVYRNGTNGSNSLPAYFGPLLNVTSQGVRATATAQALAGDAANCLKPWAVADKWQENTAPPWTQQSTFTPPTDVYIPPYGTGGTGFSYKDASGNLVNYGMQLTLKLAHPSSGNANGNGSTNTLSSGWAMELDLPNGNGNDYRSNIEGCTTVTVAIASQSQQCTAVDPTVGCVDVLTGGTTGPTKQGTDTIVGRDPSAYWDRSAKGGLGAPSSTYATSPRIVPVAVFDPALYLSQSYNGSNGIIKVVNILGFFVEGICSDSFYKEPYLDCSNNNNDVVGRLVPFAGAAVANGTPVGPGAFAVIIRLIR
jgi:Putative Flp pilus-assembly TadE/G-like